MDKAKAKAEEELFEAIRNFAISSGLKDGTYKLSLYLRKEGETIAISDGTMKYTSKELEFKATPSEV